MTAHQFNLLLAMAERAGRVLSREQLMEAGEGRGPRGLRPVDRRPRRAHPRGDRGRPEEPSAHPDGPRRGLRLREEPGRVRRESWHPGAAAPREDLPRRPRERRDGRPPLRPRVAPPVRPGADRERPRALRRDRERAAGARERLARRAGGRPRALGHEDERPAHPLLADAPADRRVRRAAPASAAGVRRRAGPFTSAGARRPSASAFPTAAGSSRGGRSGAAPRSASSRSSFSRRSRSPSRPGRSRAGSRGASSGSRKASRRSGPATSARG